MHPHTLSRRKLASFILASPFLASCAPERNPGGHTDASGETTVSWTMWSGGTEERRSWQEAAHTVESEHPTLTVDLQTSAFEDYFTNLGTRLAGDAAPCIVSMQSLRLGTFDEAMLPLDELIAKNDLDLTAFDDNALEALQSDGQQMALPYDNGPILMLYNKDMFEASGVPAPSAGWTIAEFEETARSLTQDAKFGYSAFPNSEPMLSMLLTYNGATAVTEKRQLTLDSPAMIEAFSWYTGLVHDLGVAPEISGNTDVAVDQFLAGNAAMVPTGPWEILNVNAQADFAVGLVPLPVGSNGPATLSAGSGFGISTSCPVVEEAFLAVASLTGSDTQEALASEGRAFPSRTAPQASWYANAPAGSEEALAAALESATPLITSDNWTQVADGIAQYGGQAFNGEKSPESVLHILQDEYGH